MRDIFRLLPVKISYAIVCIGGTLFGGIVVIIIIFLDDCAFYGILYMAPSRWRRLHDEGVFNLNSCIICLR